MRKVFGPQIKRIIETIYGPEPIGVAGMDRLMGYNQRMLSGSGTRPYWGLNGSPELTENGPAVNPQFNGNVLVAAQGNSIPVEQAAALPSGRVPSKVSSAVSPQFADYMSFEGA